MVAQQQQHERHDGAARAATVSAAVRQPWWSVSRASSGRKISWPVAPPAVSTPVTRPRRADEPAVGDGRDEDQRHRAGAEPDQHAPAAGRSCQLCVMKTVSPLPAATSSSAHVHHPADAEPLHQRGGERRVRPYSSRLTETADADRAARPAELVVQRVDQHAGQPEAGRADQRHEGDGGDEPGPVEPRCGAAVGSGDVRRSRSSVTDRAPSSGRRATSGRRPSCARIRP